jgi:UDP-N-acetyl-D-mannosaminuronic acid dehydrogenase
MLENLEQETLATFLTPVTNQEVSLVVVGSGYVGLPTAALFAQVGYDVTAIDIRKTIVDSINKGISPIQEPGLASVLSHNVKSGKLRSELLCQSSFHNKDVIIITVQTPIDENKKPNLTFLMNAIRKIGPELQKGTLVAVCSTVPPGTILGPVKDLLTSLSGLIAEEDFYLAYVPERIAPGIALKEFVESPRLVGGIGPNSTRIASDVFRKVCKNVIETDATTAEISKTAENTFRDINIAFANQLALICEQHQADIVKVIELANTHPRVKIHSPGPGVGGPCLTKDPYLLINKTNLDDRNIIETARKINDYMPLHMVEIVKQSLKESGKYLKESRITLLGIAYKSNVDDSRFSPSQTIIQELLRESAEVIVFDPYCKEDFGAKRKESLIESARGSDCLIIMTNHDDFEELDLFNLKFVMNENPSIIDGKRILEPRKATDAGFKYFGVGYGKKN